MKGQTTTIAGAIADRDGNFRVIGLRPGTFTIRVAYIGYAPVIQDITLTPRSPVLDLGVSKLAPVATTLDAVTIQEERAAVVTEPDRTAYRVKENGSKGTLQVSPFYRRTSDVIPIDINITDTLDSREVTSISFHNMQKSNSWGSDVTGQLRASPKFTALTNVSVFKTVTDGGSTSAVGSDALGWMGRINVTSEVTKTITLQGDRAALLVRVADPFELLSFRIKTGDGKVEQLTERNPESRMVFVGYQYSFGRPPRVRQVAPDQTGGGSVGFGAPPGGGGN